MVSIATQIRPAATAPEAAIAPKSASTPAAAQPDTGESIDSVHISGHAQLLSRLFNTDNINADIPVAQTRAIEGALYTAFLTTDDRKMLEKAYEYASTKGIDPRHVDDFGRDLALYREGPNDKGFLNSILKPGTGAVHFVSFEFLEKMVTVFSTSSQPQVDPANAGDFSRFLSATSKTMLTQAFLDILSHPSNQTSAHILDIAAVLGLPLTNPDGTAKTALDIINSPGGAVDNSGKK